MAARALLCKLMRIAMPPPAKQPRPSGADDDPVLEWTYLLLLQLLKAGAGAGVFEACGVRVVPGIGQDEGAPVLFTPEQLVLLHLLEQAVDDKHATAPDGAASSLLLAADDGRLCEALVSRIVAAAGWLDTRAKTTSGDSEDFVAAVAANGADAALLGAGAAAAVRVVGGVLAGLGYAERGRREALVALGLVGSLLRLLRREGGAADGSIPRVGDDR